MFKKIVNSHVRHVIHKSKSVTNSCKLKIIISPTKKILCGMIGIGVSGAYAAYNGLNRVAHYPINAIIKIIDDSNKSTILTIENYINMCIPHTVVVGSLIATIWLPSYYYAIIKLYRQPLEKTYLNYVSKGIKFSLIGLQCGIFTMTALLFYSITYIIYQLEQEKAAELTCAIYRAELEKAAKLTYEVYQAELEKAAKLTYEVYQVKLEKAAKLTTSVRDTAKQFYNEFATKSND